MIPFCLVLVLFLSCNIDLLIALFKPVDEPAEEEVDIGGDDLPSSSFPPVEIQKDITTHRNSKCSSSSSSSGDSGSSSSGLCYDNPFL